MADKLTTTQRALDDVLVDVSDRQRTFASNYEDALKDLRRAILHEVTIATAAGLVLGGLVGALVGGRRR